MKSDVDRLQQCEHIDTHVLTTMVDHTTRVRVRYSLRTAECGFCCVPQDSEQ